MALALAVIGVVAFPLVLTDNARLGFVVIPSCLAVGLGLGALVQIRGLPRQRGRTAAWIGIALALPPVVLTAVATGFRAAQGQGAIFVVNAIVIVVSLAVSFLLFWRVSSHGHDSDRVGSPGVDR